MSTKLETTLLKIWERNLDRMLERVQTLEDGVVALLDRSISEEQRNAAEHEAHKLAGSLGTFGLAEGSRLAREAEHIWLRGTEQAAAQAWRLSELTVAIRALVEKGPAPVRKPAADHPQVLIVHPLREEGERLAAHLGSSGYQARWVGSGQEARRSLAQDHPAGLLLDIGHDREGALALLTELQGGAPMLKVVLAARDDLADRIMVARLGARCFLTSQMPPSYVAETVAALLATAPPVALRAVVAGTAEGLAFTAKVHLQRAGMQVEFVSDLATAWATVTDRHPDLLVVEAGAPGFAFGDLCTAVRSDPRIMHLPIILIGTRPADQEEGYRVGADDFLFLPSADMLITRVQQRLASMRWRQHLGKRDPLTQVPTLVGFSAEMERALQESDGKGRGTSVAVINVQGLREINQRYGYISGDSVMVELTHLLTEDLRAKDLLTRMDGARCLIVLPATSAAECRKRLRQVQELFHRKSFLSAQGERFRGVGFTFGVAESPADGTTLAQLQQKALERLELSGQDRSGERVGAQESATSAADQEYVDVLLAEDDEALASLVLHVLEGQGYRTLWLQDGESVLETLTGEHAAVVPRLILLDIGLPGVDGLAILRRLGLDGWLERTKVIMLTARSSERDILAAFELGAIDHVAKPVSLPILLKRIGQALGE